jgi:hypothetical protein
MRRRQLFPAALLALPLARLRPAFAADGDGATLPPGITIPPEQMQRAVAQHFPRRFPVQGLLNLDLQAPLLQLLPALNRVGAEMAVSAAGPALNRRHEGSLGFDFALRYEPRDNTLRAVQLRVQRLKFPSLRAEVVEMLNAYAPALAEQSVHELVLHQLSDKDLAMATLLGLRPGAITVTDAGLRIALVVKPL